jgi:serine/threonine protein kinase
VSNTAREFVSACLTGDPTKRPTATEMLQHRWLADEKPHFVPDPDSPTGGPRDLLPHIQKRLGAKARCEFLRHPIFVSVMLKLFISRSPSRRVGNHSDEADVDTCFTFYLRRRTRSEDCQIQRRIRERGCPRSTFAVVLHDISGHHLTLIGRAMR